MIRLIKSAVPALLVVSSIAFADGAFAPAPAPAAPAVQQAAPPRLEYTVRRYHPGFNNPETDLAKITNDLAAEGWTLVSTSGAGEELFLFFSRPRS